MKIRKCNYPQCNKVATIIEPFSSMGATDAKCDKHQKIKTSEKSANQKQNKGVDKNGL